jgi:ApaG protein
VEPLDFVGYSIVTGPIKVTVQPEHLSESSAPDEAIFAFRYTVRIENLGGDAVQLLERHWLISSGGLKLAEVVGPGVVGEQPRIGPLEVFEYSSTTVIQDPIGEMRGSYTFRSEAGSYFDALIPPFDLHYPVVIH